MALKKKVAPAAKKNARPVGFLNEEWARLLEANETRKPPLTDEQLTAAMEKIFPDRAGKTTLTRVSMIRGAYNNGTNLFAQHGPAKRRSYAYTSTGEQVPPRGKAKVKAKPTAKANTIKKFKKVKAK